MMIVNRWLIPMLEIGKKRRAGVRFGAWLTLIAVTFPVSQATPLKVALWLEPATNLPGHRSRYEGDHIDGEVCSSLRVPGRQREAPTVLA